MSNMHISFSVPGLFRDDSGMPIAVIEARKVTIGVANNSDITTDTRFERIPVPKGSFKATCHMLAQKLGVQSVQLDKVELQTAYRKTQRELRNFTRRKNITNLADQTTAFARQNGFKPTTTGSSEYHGYGLVTTHYISGNQPFLHNNLTC